MAVGSSLIRAHPCDPWFSPLNSRILAALCIAVSFTATARAGDLPSAILDLRDWKLQLPVETERRGTPDEVWQPELATFVDPRHFFPTEAGDGVVFRAPCGGATTKGSKYPRCELREMTAGGTRPAAWGTDDGAVHRLTARLAVTRTPPVKPHVVCAQIHDGRDDVLQIRLERRRLFIQRDGHPDVVLDPDYRLGTPFDLTLKAAAGHIRVTHNARPTLDWKTSRSGCYFKAGCYTQSNVERGDAAEAVGEVVIWKLHVNHARE